MRPLSLSERGVETPIVSLRSLLSGERGPVTGSTSIGLDAYVREIVHGGPPGLRNTAGRAQRAALDAYVRRIVDRDFPEAGLMVRKPDLLSPICVVFIYRGSCRQKWWQEQQRET